MSTCQANFQMISADHTISTCQ